MPKHHQILIATDGSTGAQAALETAARFPWPASSRAQAVLSRCPWLPSESTQAQAAFEKSFELAAAEVRKALTRRWPDAKAVIFDAPPVDAILAEAKRLKTSLVVLGWRGHGTFRRLLAGSVSRAVAANAACPVLVVRKAPSAVRRFVVAFDGGRNAERALEFLGTLEPGRGSSVVLVNVVEPLSAPASVGRLPSSTRAHIRREVHAINKERHEQGRATAAVGAARLESLGWKAKSEVRTGDPLASLLKAVAEHRADVFVLGARATSGLERALLGSVANGALNRSPVPVMLVR
jgi:nucleotide-binding universal stress UspA family protein